MTDIDIIRMAKEAGGDDWGIFKDFMPEIERFAKLVAAAERNTICDLLNRLVDTYESMDRQGSAEDIKKLIQHIQTKGES